MTKYLTELWKRSGKRTEGEGTVGIIYTNIKSDDGKIAFNRRSFLSKWFFSYPELFVLRYKKGRQMFV